MSVSVEILLDKFFSHRPTERLLAQWQLLGLDVAAGTVAGGLQRIEPLLQPLDDAMLSRNASSSIAQAVETRWMVFITDEALQMEMAVINYVLIIPHYLTLIKMFCFGGHE